MVHQGYMSGGAGYVLSKEALNRFVNNAMPDKKLCREFHDSEDIIIGQCLENVGVIAGDTRDDLSRARFLPFSPESHLTPPKFEGFFWYWVYLFYKTDDGLDCCSDNAISFHYITPLLMYVFEYFIYELNPYGVTEKYNILPNIITLEQVMVERRKDLAFRARDKYSAYRNRMEMNITAD